MNFNNKNFIIHIGLHKTGSTFIQKHLNLIKDKSYRLFVLDEFCELLVNYLEDPSDFKKKNLHNIINNTKESEIVISSEAIFGHHYNGFVDINRRFELLEDLFKNIKYILCFREPSSITYSTYLGLLINVDHKIKFEDYINKEISDLHKKIKIHSLPRTTKNVGTNYKIFNYNEIFRNYLNIQNRVLFIEFEKFFKDKDVTKLKEFIGANIDFDFSQKENYTPKSIIYLQFYDNFLVFKFIKVLLINFFKLFNKISSGRDILFLVVNLVEFFNKFIPEKYYNNYSQKVQKILNEIKTYHSKNYIEFKKKLNKDLHIFSDS